MSPRVVVALGVLLLGGGGRIEEEEEEKEKRSDPERTEKPLLLVRVKDGLHWTVSKRARKVTDWQQRNFGWRDSREISSAFSLLLLLFREVSVQLAS